MIRQIPEPPFSLAVTLRPHLCSQGPYLSLLPPLKGSGIQEELEELLLAVGPQAQPVVAMTTMPASIFFKPLFPALPLSLSCLCLLGAPAVGFRVWGEDQACVQRWGKREKKEKEEAQD